MRHIWFSFFFNDERLCFLFLVPLSSSVSFVIGIYLSRYWFDLIVHAFLRFDCSWFFLWCYHLYFWLDLTSLSIIIFDKSKWVCLLCLMSEHLFTPSFKTTSSSLITIFCANFNLISWILRTYINLFLSLMTSHSFLLPSWLVDLTHPPLVSCILWAYLYPVFIFQSSLDVSIT